MIDTPYCILFLNETDDYMVPSDGSSIDIETNREDGRMVDLTVTQNEFEAIKAAREFMKANNIVDAVHISASTLELPSDVKLLYGAAIGGQQFIVYSFGLYLRVYNKFDDSYVEFSLPDITSPEFNEDRCLL